MTTLMIRTKVKPEHTDEIEAAVHKVFLALEREQPKGIRYASCRLPDGVTYLVLLALDEGIDNPLPQLPEFRIFQEKLKDGLAETATPEPVTVVGSYRLF